MGMGTMMLGTMHRTCLLEGWMHLPAHACLSVQPCLIQCLLQGIYYEARATNIDPFNRKLTLVKEYCEVGSGSWW